MKNTKIILGILVLIVLVASFFLPAKLVGKLSNTEKKALLMKEILETEGLQNYSKMNSSKRANLIRSAYQKSAGTTGFSKMSEEKKTSILITKILRENGITEGLTEDDQLNKIHFKVSRRTKQLGIE